MPGPNEHVVALVYHSTALKQSHSLADARSILVQGVQEPRYETKRETGGTYFRLYDHGDHEISVSETATYRVVDGKRSGRIGKPAIVIETGYSFGGPLSCR